MRKIFIQGEVGSFHHETAIKLFGDSVEVSPCSTFHQVFQSLNDDDNLGLVAIENSLYGSINEVYDLLEKTGAQIFAEAELSIHQNLIVLPTAEIRGIKEVYSHPVALAQCENYLEEHLPHAERVEFEDTAAAVRFITERNDPTLAAIAGTTAAEMYGAKILAKQIEDNPVNFTRFVAITKNPENAPSDVRQSGKSSIVLTTNHRPGALYEALGVFVAHQINLTKLQSRPVVGEKWHYRFYLDFEASPPETSAIIAELNQLGNSVTHLGDY